MLTHTPGPNKIATLSWHYDEGHARVDLEGDGIERELEIIAAFLEDKPWLKRGGDDPENMLQLFSALLDKLGFEVMFGEGIDAQLT